MVLRMSLRMGEHLGPERVRIGVRLVGEPPQRMTPARRRLIEVLSDGLLHGKSEAAKEAGVSAGVIDGLVDEGTLAVEADAAARRRRRRPIRRSRSPSFSRQQRTAVDAMRALAANGSFHVALLDGVTGSGKTEVYFEAIAETIRRGKQSLILMPEIALTGAVPRSLRAAFRRASAGMAFRTDAAHPRAQLGGDRGGRSAGRGRRALGAVSALCRSRPDRRR